MNQNMTNIKPIIPSSITPTNSCTVQESVPSNITKTEQESVLSQITPSNSCIKQEYVEFPYFNIAGDYQTNKDWFNWFTKRYDRLSFQSKVRINIGQNKDYRIYSEFHSLPKYVRENDVLFDGEHLTEVWDLHNAMFTLLCAHLDITNGIRKEELNKLKDLSFSGRLYEQIMEYSKSYGTISLLYPYMSRDEAKMTSQKFLSGKLSSYDDIRNIAVINYFKYYFPCFSYYVKHYPRHFDPKQLRYKKNGDIDKRSAKISNLHGDILRHETNLISGAMAYRLFLDYGITCLTVHDAIYVKNSDIEKLGENPYDFINRLFFNCFREYINAQKHPEEYVNMSYALF